MTLDRAWMKLTVILLATAVPLSHAVTAQVANDASHEQAGEQDRVAFSHALPRMDGQNLNATIVEVTYGPGGSSPAYTHPCAVIGYVTHGALRTQVKGEAEVVYKAGQSFYEAPNGVHMVSANASNKVPVKFLAYFVCDHSTPLSLPATEETHSSGGHKP
jgi:quercetin dioxygenase-like cupin family protein